MVSALRIAFFGTPGFAVPTLQRLIASPHQVVAAIVQPDRPRGRGQRVSEPPVKQVARSSGVQVLQPDTLRDPEFRRLVEQLHPDLGVVAAYGKILPEWLLSIPRLGMVNVHASLLPKYRGAAPIHRAIMAGERETGVTIMRVVRALDAGPMLARRSHVIHPDDTSEDVERVLAGLGADLLIETLENLIAGTISEVPQDDTLATHAARLTRSDGVLDWHASSMAIHNQVRGLHPWPHAHTWLGQTRYVIRRTETPAPAGPLALTPPEPGSIVEARGDTIRIATGDGALRVLELQLDGRRPMDAREFLAGHRLPEGAVFQAAPSS